ncbi:MAG: hypothetical protein ACK4F7_07790 [Inhella sp.]
MLELLLRLLPVSTASLTGYYLNPDLLGYPPSHRWTVSTGWDLRNPQRLQANAQGFLADRDFVPDPRAIALIGDSYVEASMLDAADRPAAQLERLIGGEPVYALGTPGTALLDYGQRMLWAAETLGSRRFVLLLERGDIVQSLCGSGNVVSRCLDPVGFAPRREPHSPATGLKRWLRHSSLAQYLVGHLRVDVAAFLRSVLTRQVPGEEASAEPKPVLSARPTAEAMLQARARIDAVLQVFLADLAPVLAQADVLILLDGARTPPWLEGTNERFEREYLMERLRHHGLRVIDLQPVYQAHAVRSHRALEIGPHDRHLNSLGVSVVMQAAAQDLAR